MQLYSFTPVQLYSTVVQYSCTVVQFNRVQLYITVVQLYSTVVQYSCTVVQSYRGHQQSVRGPNERVG